MYQNKLSLIGFLGNDATIHTTTNRCFVALSLATVSSYKDKRTGKYVRTTEWHRCIVWGKLADFAKALTKGAHVQVEGELHSREYVDPKQGDIKRRVWEVRVDSILKLDRAERATAKEQQLAAEELEEVPL
jgi:single-strand DNA-binding protein